MLSGQKKINSKQMYPFYIKPSYILQLDKIFLESFVKFPKKKNKFRKPNKH